MRSAKAVVVVGLALVVASLVWVQRVSAVEAGAISYIPVVQKGKALAQIVIPADATKPTQDAAALLANYIERSTTVRLDVVKEPAPANALIAIHCGATDYAKGLNLGVEKLDIDGFVIAFPDERHIVLLGASDSGQDYAAYEFLERYVGVRWLFPGKVGEYVPLRESLAVPAQEIREEPWFQHRLLSGLGLKEKPENKGEQSLWARRNRMRGRIEFHHNLWRLFPPERYGKTHPEFFPILKGRRFIPQPALGKTTEQDERAQISWQLCFTAKGIIGEAVKNICAYFEKNPQATSYSLGVNDGFGYCECPECSAKNGGRTNALDLPDASVSYFAWCNAVARGVNKQYPGKVFGLLAYSSVYSPPPGLRLDEHIVPFITYDRMKWVDPEIEHKGQNITEEWEKSASVLGWYDYIYGGQLYTAPRVYFHKMAEYLRYGQGHKVRNYYAEAYPSADWHEGPKLYVLLKLLWDPGRDVDDLLKEWYEAAVGPEAAPYLAKYFALWEEFWTKRVPNTQWFRENGDQQYLSFSSSLYLEALTIEDVVTSEALLKKAAQTAGDELQRARAKFFFDGFLARRSEYLKYLPFKLPENPTSR